MKARNWREKWVYLSSMILSRIINRGKHLHSIQPKHILCIREDEIGDMCYSLHVFDMLHRQYPNALLTILCKPYTITLLNNIPYISHLTSNYADLKDRYDVIIDLRGSWKSIAFAIKHRPAIRLDRASIRFHNAAAAHHPHEVETNLQVVAPLIQPNNRHTHPTMLLSKADEKKADDFLVDLGIKRFVIIHPGARKQLRKWPLYAPLATYFNQQHQLDIVFTGDASEATEVKALQQQIPFTTYSVAGLFNLTELAALCKRAQLYVGNESGPLHIAAINGTPSLGLYGPGEPYVFYPHGERTAVIHPILECNPCDQVHCVHPENPCIQRITLEEVIQKAESLLSSSHGT